MGFLGKVSWPVEEGEKGSLRVAFGRALNPKKGGWSKNRMRQLDFYDTEELIDREE